MECSSHYFPVLRYGSDTRLLCVKDNEVLTNVLMSHSLEYLI